MERAALILLVLMAAGAGMSLILTRLIKNKWIWYFPSIIGLIFVIYYTWKIESRPMEGFEELGYVLMTMMILSVMTGNILTNIIIGLKRRKEEKHLNG